MSAKKTTRKPTKSTTAKGKTPGVGDGRPRNGPRPKRTPTS